MILVAGCTGEDPAPGIPSSSATSAPDHGANADAELAEAVRGVIEARIDEYALRSVIVRVTRGSEEVVAEAFGESMTGVPATVDMHFRNGAVAISYVATALLILVDDGVVSLDDPLSTWLPDVPHSDRVTLGQLARMTSGYADYLWSPELLGLLNDDPFRTWTPEELHPYGTSLPLLYDPGTNWNYSHTNYVLLGMALERITGGPVDRLLEERVLEPLGLENTRDPGSPEIAEPVLHAFTAERRAHFGVPAGQSFLEESTFWNPSWTITRGAIQYTDIVDMTRTARAIGTGELLSAESHAAQVDTGTRAIATLIDGCPACFPQSEIYTYGIGVVMMADWILQNPMFSGTSAVEAYLPDEDVALAVVVTFDEAAFDADGNVPMRATDLFHDLSGVVAPGSEPPQRAG